jgi:hypothetical protein
VRPTGPRKGFSMPAMTAMTAMRAAMLADGPSMTLWAAVIVVALVGVLGFGLVVGMVVLFGLLRSRRTWRAPSVWTDDFSLRTTELQDPQFADRGRPSDPSVSDAHDTAIAVVGLGIHPFTNRAPLSVPRNEHSIRHG